MIGDEDRDTDGGSGAPSGARAADPAPLLRGAGAVLAGTVAALVAAALLVVALGALGFAAGFSTDVPARRDDEIGLALTMSGGCVAIVAFAAGGWVAAKVAGGGWKRGAALGALVAVGAALVVVGVAWAWLRPAADVRGAAIELGIFGVPDRAAEAAIRPGTAARVPDWRFFDAVAKTGAYAVTVFLFLLGAAALGGVAGSASPPAGSADGPATAGRRPRHPVISRSRPPGRR